MVKKLLLAIVPLAVVSWGALPADAQEKCPIWIGDSSCRVDWDLPPNHVSVFRDYFGNHGPSWPWKATLDKDATLGVHFFQKPRFVLWLQPVQRVWGLKLFFDF